MMKDYHVDVQCQEHIVRPTIDQINSYFHTMNERKCQLVICVMSGRNEEELTQLKAHIKNCGTMKYGKMIFDFQQRCSLIEILGVMTQCALLSKIADSRSLRTYCENLIRKINHKNAGINTKVNLDEALKKKKSQTDSYMFFGADVIHPTNVTRQHPSIAGIDSFDQTLRIETKLSLFFIAVVGSGDSLCSTTAVRVCQQYPREGKCSIETILGLTDMVEQLLDYYRLTNKVLPNKIVFYRDGKVFTRDCVDHSVMFFRCG